MLRMIISKTIYLACSGFLFVSCMAVDSDQKDSQLLNQQQTIEEDRWFNGSSEGQNRFTYYKLTVGNMIKKSDPQIPSLQTVFDQQTDSSHSESPMTDDLTQAMNERRGPERERLTPHKFLASIASVSSEVASLIYQATLGFTPALKDSDSEGNTVNFEDGIVLSVTSVRGFDDSPRQNLMEIVVYNHICREENTTMCLEEMKSTIKNGLGINERRYVLMASRVGISCRVNHQTCSFAFFRHDKNNDPVTVFDTGISEHSNLWTFRFAHQAYIRADLAEDNLSHLNASSLPALNIGNGHWYTLPTYPGLPY